MKTYLYIAQVAVSVMLMTAILLQARGGGLGAAFGGDSNIYRTKRGVEKVLHRGTVVLSVVFFGLALAVIFVPQA